MKNQLLKILMTAIAVSGLFAVGANAQRRGKTQSVEPRDLYSDTWVATDAIGRTMPTSEQTGGLKDGHRRVVGIFYITWHTQGLADMPSPYGGDVTKILEADPSARLDANHPLWTVGSYHYAEPEMGYFLSQDTHLIAAVCRLEGHVGLHAVAFPASQ